MAVEGRSLPPGTSLCCPSSGTAPSVRVRPTVAVRQRSRWVVRTTVAPVTTDIHPLMAD